MVREYSPFSPGQPVSPELFAGRGKDVEFLVQKAGAASSGRLEVLFVEGERGIGKSSLCSYARLAAEEKHGILGVHCFLGGVTKLSEMVRRVFERMLMDSRERSWHSKVRDFLGKHVKEVGIFGVTLRFEASQKELEHLVYNFSDATRKLLKNLKNERSGLMLILDDLNGLASSEDFANWLKSLVDEIATSGDPVPLLLVLVGLPERRDSLIRNQESLARVFDLVTVSRLLPDEVKSFYSKCFERVGITVEPEAMETLQFFSGGHPVAMHEIGDAAFNLDDNNLIDNDEALQAVKIAAERIGRKYIEPKVYKAIRSQQYRKIIPRLTKLSAMRFERKEIVRKLSGEEKRVFDNFLNRMKSLGVIAPDETKGRGAYRFCNELHWVFFMLSPPKTD